MGKGNKVLLGSDDKDRKTNANVLVTCNGDYSNIIDAKGKNTKVHVEETNSAYMNIFANDKAEIDVKPNKEDSITITNESNGGKINKETDNGFQHEGHEDMPDPTPKKKKEESLFSKIWNGIKNFFGS